MPGLAGLDAARLILAHRPDQVIVLFSADIDGMTQAHARDLGVAACVTKTDASHLPTVLASLVF